MNRNLIENGDLEQGVAGAPRDWSQSSWGKLTARFIYPVPGHGGGRAAGLVVTHRRSGDAGWQFRLIPASDNTVYAFSDECRSNVVTNVTVEFHLSSGGYQYEWLGDAEATGGAWKIFRSQITVPKNATSLTVLHVLDKDGSLAIDNASLTAIPDDSFPQAMVTLAFDDGRTSQFNYARPILNASGLKATYAIITKADGDGDVMSWAEIMTLYREGNEIAAHSRTHPDLTAIPLAQLKDEIAGSYRDLARRGMTPTTFVYPYGTMDSKAERLVRGAGFSGARGSYFGLNGRSADKFNLQDIVIDKTTPTATVEEWIDQAIAHKRWVIFELHDVSPRGGDDYAIAPRKLQQIVTYIEKSGIKVVTLQEGIQLMNLLSPMYSRGVQPRVARTR
jgi:peptidoglycan/xylan/chitin deacetylase (PgdA/CDA1 family)